MYENLYEVEKSIDEPRFDAYNSEEFIKQSLLKDDPSHYTG